MYMENSFLWFWLFWALFLCELYVPFGKKVLLPFDAAFFLTVIFSQFEESLFAQCVFSISAAFSIYVIAQIVQIIFRYLKQKPPSFVRVIALTDIEIGGFGYVYGENGRFVVKNTYDKKIKKGELVDFSDSQLSGERIV